MKLTAQPKCLVMAMLGVTALTQQINAQESAFSIEEVIVTAQKRAQSVQDVGITMSAFGGDELKEMNVSDVVNVAANVPNVQVNYGLGNNFFNIRGLGLNEFTANLDAPVAVHVDEVYQSKGFLTGMTLFDIERVEVLKGPQGDLFGRNTTGGAVNFFTRRPEDTFSGNVTLGYGNYQTQNFEGYVTGPIADNLSGRLSGYMTRQEEGFYKNTTRGTTEGKVDEIGLRGQLLWNLEDTEILLSLHYGKDRSELLPYEGLGNTQLEGGFCPEYLDGSVKGNTPNCLRGLDLLFNPGAPISQYQPGEDDPYTTQNNLSFTVDNEAFGGLVKVEHKFDNAILTSITGYENFDQNQREDSDNSSIQSIEVYWYTEFEQFTQEFRLTSDLDHDRYNYIIGLFYEHDDYYNGDYLTAYANVFDGLNNYSRYNQTVDAFAAFAHLEFQLTESFRIINGVRFTWEETELNGGTFGGSGITDFGGEEKPETIGAAIASSDLIEGGNVRRDEDVSFKVSAEWTPNNDSMVYASVSTGFRSGGFSVAFANSQDELTALAPEEMTAYEVGFKSSWMEDTFRLNGAMFRYDFRDGHIDVDAPGSPVPITINAAEIETIGAELDLHWRPLEGLDLKAGMGWVDNEVKSDLTLATGIGPVSLKGNRPAFSPEWTFNGQVRYEAPIGDSMTAIFSTDFSWRDDHYLEVNNQPSNLLEAYWLVNARISIGSADDQWRASIWGKNITEEEYTPYLNDLPAFGWLLKGYAPPATYGISLDYNF
ncbi:TonB-dependent receptor [Pseudomaricurvus alkylphenolicus]|uniref:TonB-dependent receptor n=1 Tax=Pseudomaricurvus alkylphenolicus TaxID=1306991 RepID=UPI0014227C01|nr:TonB-dependent receptor [Pseudomaricurvus alkylphenolicus]NIB38634.1 TonB-dependent receptor [Pseudomaricurvus alkylphenolicus]